MVDRDEIAKQYKLPTVEDEDSFTELPNGRIVYYRDKSHRYYELADGVKSPLVSVTSVLRCLDKGDAITQWAWNLGQQNIDWRDARQERATSGTSVHAALEALATDGTSPDLTDFPEADHGYVQALCAWWLDHAPETVDTEVVVAHPVEGYAGRFDLLARVGGRLWLLDLKTGKRVYREAHLQLAAYREAMVACGYEELPDALGVVRAGEDGVYEFVETKASSEQFLTVLRTHRAMKALAKDLRVAA